MKQIIIARKDLGMSVGKISVQISHASMAFLSTMIRENTVVQRIHYYPARAIGPDGNPCPQMYKRTDLSLMALDAFDAGKDGFYARPVNPDNPYGPLEPCEPDYEYICEMQIDKNLYENWLGGIFTKVVCEAKNYNAIMKAVRIAEELGLQEGKDFFLIKDCCLTELTPEEYDENGVGRTLTCIGFRPLPVEIANQISKKFQLYK